CPVFFFQAEDGIRDGHVTGVQTCALPIWGDRRQASDRHRDREPRPLAAWPDFCSLSEQNPWRATPPRPSGTASATPAPCRPHRRSEERRVGKECRVWWWS